MASTSYPYPYADFPNDKVAPDKLAQQITADPAIIPSLDMVNGGVVADDTAEVCTIWFLDALDTPGEAALDAVVAAHDGEPTSSPQPVTISGAAFRPDGKQEVLVKPSHDGWATLYTGAGDDPNPTPPASGRGDGTPLTLALAGDAADGHVDLSFIEPIEVHDGEVAFDPDEGWDHSDRFSVSVIIPACPVTSTPGTGNANKVDTGQGFSIYVPASGDGQYTIDLADATPVPDDSKSGYWSCDNDTGEVTPGPMGTGAFLLLDVQLEMFFLKNMPCGSPRGVFEVETETAQWVHPNWNLRLWGVKNTTGAGTLGGWLKTFREKVQ